VRRFSRLAAALAATIGVIVVARADDVADLRQELESLRSKIEQIDADITDTAHGNAGLKDQSDAYAAKVQANTATGQELKERGQQLAARKAQLDTEHDAAEQTCHKATATTEEYKAALAQCETAGQSYKQHADAYRDDQQRLATDYAAYNAASKDLQAQYKDIEQKREDVLARRDALHNTRQETLNRFNEVRDRLIALQSKPK
jgi:chromosome segregation ATPase